MIDNLMAIVGVIMIGYILLQQIKAVWAYSTVLKQIRKFNKNLDTKSIDEILKKFSNVGKDVDEDERTGYT